MEHIIPIHGVASSIAGIAVDGLFVDDLVVRGLRVV
jgi:hypothetical protein